MFWVTTACSLPRRCSSTMARCPRFGSAVHAGVVRRFCHASRRTSRIGEVVLQRRRLLGRRVLGPHALRPAEVGDAGVGRDPGAGQDGDPLGVVDPAAHGVEARHTSVQSRRRAFRSALVGAPRGGTGVLHPPTDPPRRSSAPSTTPPPFHPDARPVDPPLPRLVQVVPWDDPVVDRRGHDPRSAYVEQFWLSVLGPTATWLLRRLVAGFDHHPAGYELVVADAARGLGLSVSKGMASPFAKALQRCVMFGVVNRLSERWIVRRRVPPISQRHLLRLPPALQRAHEQWTAHDDPPRHAGAGAHAGPGDARRRRRPRRPGTAARGRRRPRPHRRRGLPVA